MSVPGTCCPVQVIAPLPQAAAAEADRPSAAAPSLHPLRSRGHRPSVTQYCNRSPSARSAAPATDAESLMARPLLFLGLLQIVLGCFMVAFDFGMMSLSSSPKSKNTCAFWASFSVILAGLLGITTWKKPMLLLDNLFLLISITSALLNLDGFILGNKDINFVSSVSRCDLVYDEEQDKICFCCKEFNDVCTAEEAVLKLHHKKMCSTTQLTLKRILFALCGLNALTTTVCLAAAIVCYLQISAGSRSYRDESQIEDQDDDVESDDSVPHEPPPSYFETLNSLTPQRSRRMLGSYVISLPRIYGSQIKGIQEFCPMDPPPPYQVAWSQNSSEQEDALLSVSEVVDSAEGSDRQASQGDSTCAASPCATFETAS